MFRVHWQCALFRVPYGVHRGAAGCCLAITAAFFSAGCGSSSTALETAPTDVPSLSTRPLTVEIWQESTDPEKYAPETLARLRAEVPALKSLANWKKFHREVVVPGFQRDVAGTGGPSPPPSSE
ncbi:hypothetical protein [Caulifigura coniformis]|uniref:hypothetical protein n=1 Tax=Caulifigura coniformis TaxID=2527983 RepID=UPI00119F3CCE|nr:hypothetical protein [Caulifigura coniformis]